MRIFVGNDIIEVKRIAKAMEDNAFIDSVFTEKEIAYCNKFNNDLVRAEHYAARFAGKEAVYKAISPLLNFPTEITWKNIEITNDEIGRPSVKIIQNQTATTQSFEGKNGHLNKIDIDLSLSHIEDFAMATAVAEVK